MSGSGSGKRGAAADVDEGDEPAKKKAKLDSGWSFEDLDGSEGEIDCGCCFTPYPFNKLIQCPEAHLFCTDCMTNYVSNLLGMQDPNIKCMDQSGCKEHFTEGELRRFMSPKLLELYEKVRMRREIESAQLEGLEECPYCEYKVVIESAEEKLFRCENKECGAVTCRFCKKDDHLPKSCKEVEDDKKIDARHAVEEAMTKALMRNCPKCQKAFIKEYGCNKMTCPYCRTLSCYICRQIITGYEHFAHPPPYTGRQDSNKCALWDPVEKRHSDEVSRLLFPSETQTRPLSSCRLQKRGRKPSNKPSSPIPTSTRKTYKSTFPRPRLQPRPPHQLACQFTTMSRYPLVSLHRHLCPGLC
ncbi:hypothetical protein GLOTRDRAFT_78895 [Gloeophyllum trabeum ATCC 11539]|uniref:RING-type domain-containing protein n=1 Tax=Gloeophyllum trabeum (strain ATCC 11539 / FP-39264 / Madison 617) TaxID=670483 RepID=S7RM66_GLOTA|nr:uncharacterized protein GLOTRDRAFT_78895 [Gloeophyllum trabeum ATCC 11539]EPQ53809.1 hypothetical protein GLOTRDRAFT_78895 [Gloeophyllum trabeum ATCC 11539]